MQLLRRIHGAYSQEARVQKAAEAARAILEREAINQLDAPGKSIFDVLDEVKSESAALRAASLRDALKTMSDVPAAEQGCLNQGPRR